MIERTIAIGLTIALAACGREEPAGNVTEERATVEPAPTAAEAPAVPAAAGDEPIGYTSLKPGDCRLLEENREEAGYSKHRCAGLAGYALETSESDLRQDIVVIAPDGKRSELGLSGRVAKGAFNTLGRWAEWRGADKAAPSALIVRLGVANGAEPNRPDTSNLVVVRLSPAACVVAVIPPGPRQNEDARGRADKLQDRCLPD